jgi:hypothetical protein
MTTSRLSLYKPVVGDSFNEVIVPAIATNMQAIDDQAAKMVVPSAPTNFVSLSALGDIEDTGILDTGFAVDTAVLKLNGISGGSTVYGGTAAGESLILHSTNNATMNLIGLGSNSAYDEVNSRLGILTVAPTDIFEVVKSAAVLNAFITNYYTGATHNVIVGKAARFVSSVPSALSAADVLLALGARGYGTSMGSASGGGIQVNATETWGAGNGTSISFFTTPKGQVVANIAEKMRIDDNGMAQDGIYRVGVNGWIPCGETWTFGAADAPSYTFTISGDKTTKYYPGMRVKVTDNGTIKYFIITKTSYSNPNTTITVFAPTGTTMGGPLTLGYYSMEKAPLNMNMDPAIWSISITDNTGLSVGAGGNPTSLAANTWLGDEHTGGHIALPIGAWIIDIKATGMIYQTAVGIIGEMFITFSNAKSTESNPEFTGASVSYNTMSNSYETMGVPFVLFGYVVLTTKATWYLNVKTATYEVNQTNPGTKQDGIYLNCLPYNDGYIIATCAYL